MGNWRWYSINILEEPWIDTLSLAKSPTFIRDEENLQGVSVSHFIKDAKSWNKELLLQFFDDECVDHII